MGTRKAAELVAIHIAKISPYADDPALLGYPLAGRPAVASGNRRPLRCLSGWLQSRAVGSWAGPSQFQGHSVSVSGNGRRVAIGMNGPSLPANKHAAWVFVAVSGVRRPRASVVSTRRPSEAVTD